MNAAMQALLTPSSVAVFGASHRRRMARTVVRNLRDFAFPGEIYPIHPTETEVEGLPVRRSLAELPESPDCAVIALSPDKSRDVFRSAVERGVRAAVILGSGFAEADAAGAQYQREIEALARESGVAVCGPNCLGLVTPAAGATLTGYHLPADLAPGGVTAVVQSGSIFWSLAHNTRRVRFNYLISSGNEATLTAADYFDAALDDPSTRLLVGFLESIRDGERFLTVTTRAQAAGIPVVVLKVGRSQAGHAAVAAHTGALAGSDEIFTSICRQAGIIRVDSLDELYDVVEFLLAGRLPDGDRIGAITDSGGEKTLILDWGERIGLRFPDLTPSSQAGLRRILSPYVPVANPLDAWGAGNFEDVYPPALQILACDDNVDVVVLGTDMIRDTQEAALYAQAMMDLQAAIDKPIAIVSNQATGIDPVVADRVRDHGIPLLQGTEYGYKAIRRVVDYAHFISRPRPLAPVQHPLAVPEFREELAAATGIIGEYRAKQMLAAFGVPTADEVLVWTLDEAQAAAARIGYPVAIKAQGAGLEHKSDLGALQLDIRTPDELELAWQEIRQWLSRRPQPITPEAMLVQEMVPRGLELLLGLSVDPTFGPVVGVALGGVFVEFLGDCVYRRVPLEDLDAEEMLSELRGAQLLRGFRGMGPRDVRAAAQAITQFGRFVTTVVDLVAEVDVNPLIVLGEGEGVKAVDALIVPALQ